MTAQHHTTRSTLYILQCTYTRIENALNELKSMWQSENALLLLEDAVFALNASMIKDFNQIYILESDAHLIPTHLTDKISMINYLQFAELIHSAKKVHTWK